MQDLKETTSYRTALKDKTLTCAMQLFARRGIRAVKMDDIAAALGISKRTLYELYDDKEALLFTGMKKYQEQHRERMNRIVATSSNVMEVILKFYEVHMEESRDVNPLFYSDLEKYPKILEALHQEKQEKMDVYMEFMMRGVDEGYFRPDINYTLIRHLFDALGKYMMENHLYEVYSFKELYRNMLFVSLRGFCTAKGVKILDDTIFI